MTGDVMPLHGGRTAQALGIETRGGVFTALVYRDTEVPCRRSEIFTTADDGQDQIRITVYRGDSERVGDNQRVGVYELSLPNPGSRGVPQIEVTFEIDYYGGIRLHARDMATDREVPVSITW